jgi:hypothetical protein
MESRQISIYQISIGVFMDRTMSFFRSFISDANRSAGSVARAPMAESLPGLTQPSDAVGASDIFAAPLRSEVQAPGIQPFPDAGFESVEPPALTQDEQLVSKTPVKPVLQKETAYKPTRPRQPVIEARLTQEHHPTAESASADEEEGLLSPPRKAVAQTIERVSESIPVITPTLRATPPKEGMQDKSDASGQAEAEMSMPLVHRAKRMNVLKTAKAAGIPEARIQRAERNEQKVNLPVAALPETHEPVRRKLSRDTVATDRDIRSDASDQAEAEMSMSSVHREKRMNVLKTAKAAEIPEARIQRAERNEQEASLSAASSFETHAHESGGVPVVRDEATRQRNEAAMTVTAIQQAKQAPGLLSSFVVAAEKPSPPVREKSEPQVQIGTIEVIVESAPAVQQKSSPNTGFTRDPGRYYQRRL